MGCYCVCQYLYLIWPRGLNSRNLVPLASRQASSFTGLPVTPNSLPIILHPPVSRPICSFSDYPWSSLFCDLTIITSSPFALLFADGFQILFTTH